MKFIFKKEKIVSMMKKIILRKKTLNLTGPK